MQGFRHLANSRGASRCAVLKRAPGRTETWQPVVPLRTGTQRVSRAEARGRWGDPDWNLARARGILPAGPDPASGDAIAGEADPPPRRLVRRRDRPQLQPPCAPSLCRKRRAHVARGWPLRCRGSAGLQRSPALARARQRHLSACGAAGPCAHARLHRARPAAAVAAAGEARATRNDCHPRVPNKKRPKRKLRALRARTGEVACSRKQRDPMERGSRCKTNSIVVGALAVVDEV